MSPIEATAAGLILVNQWLLVRRSVWNFAFGIAGVILYGWFYWQSQAHSLALLQIYFVVVQLYGWQRWARVTAVAGEVVVLRMSGRARLRWLAGIAILTLIWGGLVQRSLGGVAPWLDAGIAMTSVAAQILLTRQRIENWYLWIAANIMTITLAALREWYVTLGLYVVMLALSVIALNAWRRAERAQGAA